MREMQEQFTFFRECQQRLSVEMWHMINECFDCMPVAAVIDDRLFSAHGGIPITTNSIEPLLSIPCPLRNPQLIPEAWEIM